MKWSGKGIFEKGIDLNTNKIIIKINPKYFRPAEVSYLKGNYSKAKRELKWQPKTNISKLIKIMIDEELKDYKLVIFFSQIATRFDVKPNNLILTILNLMLENVLRILLKS